MLRADRLLNVARALRESQAPEAFTMKIWGHACGTPACAMGHYAARTDLQDAFCLDNGGSLRDPDGQYLHLGISIAEHFGVSTKDVFELFDAPDEQWYDEEEDAWHLSGGGCGAAQTTLEAAEYIERFVAQAIASRPAEAEAKP